MPTPAQPDISLYVHFPWCVQRCPYCDFNAHRHHRNRFQADIERYSDALLADIDEEAERAGDRTVRSIFFGGGTPSLWPSTAFERVMNHIKRRFVLSPQAEITLEANPGATDIERLSDYAACGVNRLSLGIQSFQDSSLKTLGRIHGSDEAHEAITAAQKMPFEQINLDIMFALPQQSLTAAIDDLTTATRYNPGHISWYELTLEPNTPFAHRPPNGLPDPELAANMQEAGANYLANSGYTRYEVSAYQKTGRCYHNQNYWLFGDYIGVGAGAHGKLSWQQDEGWLIERRQKFATPARFMLRQRSRLQEQRFLNQNDMLLEYFINRLRLIHDPITLAEIKQYTGSTQPEWQSILNQWHEQGFFMLKPDQDWLLTEQGRHHLDTMLTMISAPLDDE